MNTAQPKLLLFDIDGTLLLSGGAGRVAFEKIFSELFSIEAAWKGLVPDGKTDPLIIEELARNNLGRELTEEEYRKVCDLYAIYFDEELPKSERFRLMPGIVELLETLQGFNNCFLGIATGNFKTAAISKLKHASLDHFFEHGGYGCDSKVRKELTRKSIERAKEHTELNFHSEHTFVIGDSIHDVAAGKAHGCKTIAVATGSTPSEELSKAGADFVFFDFSKKEVFLKAVGLEA